ncbi:MAG TPA: ABC transporter permease, partial [Bryobacteraceae bacterium]
MSKFAPAWRIQRRVITALMIRELTTRFGRENIGFLWIMVEPLLFAVLVGLIWRFMKGPEDHGVSIIAFIATGYIPLTFFRNSVTRVVKIFSVNGSLMYHRQIKIIDFVLVRCLIEGIGAMMAFAVIAPALIILGEFPVPYDLGEVVAGWLLYWLFTTSLCLILAPISEASDVLEKLVPVTTYIMIPFSGAFTMQSWLVPAAGKFLYYSPFVHGMELIREGVFGPVIDARWDPTVPLIASMVLALIGLSLCRNVRRHLVIE